MSIVRDIRKKLKAQAKGIQFVGLPDLPDISSLKNVVKGAKLLADSLREGKRTLIVGDYDADGIMATTVLYGFLREVGFSQDIVDFIIPSRLVDGYGLSPNIIKYALDNDFEVIVTVDNGIAAYDAIQMAKDEGLIVIVTDHHTAPPKLPPADVLINPKQPGETFPFIDISGATVAWYFVAALRIEFDVKIDIRKYLDFVAITVVSDVMPLNNLNLGLLDYGLRKIKARERHIFRLIWNDWTAPTINETNLGFDLVPMINAIGRINDANIGVELFLSKDKAFIEEKHAFIKEINENRKEMTRAYVLDSESMLHQEFDSQQQVVIVRNKDYHEGIVGIIAGKLAEKYQRPAFVFSWSEEKQVWKGSGRSVGNVHLYNYTNESKDTILGFGGHKGAVGLAVKDDSWDDFVKSMEKHALEIDQKDFINDSLIPFECSLNDFDYSVIEELDKFAPFGEGNPAPTFQTTAKVSIERELKGGLHYKCLISTNKGVRLTGLFFNVDKEEFLEQISGKETTFTFYPSKNYNIRTETFDFDLICQVVPKQ